MPSLWLGSLLLFFSSSAGCYCKLNIFFLCHLMYYISELKFFASEIVHSFHSMCAIHLISSPCTRLTFVNLLRSIILVTFVPFVFIPSKNRSCHIVQNNGFPTLIEKTAFPIHVSVLCAADNDDVIWWWCLHWQKVSFLRLFLFLSFFFCFIIHLNIL